MAARKPVDPIHWCGKNAHGGKICKGRKAAGKDSCRYHAGPPAGLPEGHPQRAGGAGSNLYRKMLPDRLREAYDTCDLEGVDHEVRMACAALTWLSDQFAQSPTGGITVGGTTHPDGSKTVHLLPYAQMLMTHIDKVLAIKAKRVIIVRQQQDDGLADRMIDAAHEAARKALREAKENIRRITQVQQPPTEVTVPAEVPEAEVAVEPH